MILKVTDIQKSYPLPGGGTVQILDVPNLKVEVGEQVVLLGQSGGGKTTLLHIIAGITTPDKGSILLDGIELTKLSEQGRDRVRAAKLGYVFQTFNLLPGFTALENVRLGMTFGNGKHDLARATRLLERVGLGDRLHYKPSQLSVGQQQRISVARALANRPRLLLADEPTANVDAANQQKIIDLIRETCQEEQIALIMVTHDLKLAQQFPRIERLEDLNRVLQTVAT
jgi:putative ABC transport system ATP-binding protein